MNSILIIIPCCNNSSILRDIVEKGLSVEGADLLVIDDGSTDSTFEQVAEYKGVKCIRHESFQGYGAAFQSGVHYALDYGYSIVLFIEPGSKNINDDIKTILENIEYGFDIVSCSRILENYEHESISPGKVELTAVLSARLRELTGFDITDPLSGIRGIKMSSLKDMELTDDTHGILLQLIIQAAFFGMEIIEVPSASGADFGRELDLYEEAEEMLLALMETESYLYKKGTLN